MFRLKDINVAWVIHLFALLHAAVTLACRYTELNDELFLTVLTMSMVLLICMKRWISIEFAAVCVILANVLGYILGNFGADLLKYLIGTNPTANAVATAATTEVLGWTILFVTRLFQRKNTDRKELELFSPQMHWLIAAGLLIFALRIGIVLLFSTEPFVEADILGASAKVFSNSASLVIMIAFNLLYVRWYDSYLKNRIDRWASAAILLCFIMFVTVVEIILIGYRSPAGMSSVFSSEFPVLFVTSALAEVTVYCLVFMINYALTARTEAKEAKGIANMAQYRYMKLKQQVNPHFLFNSLNILDCLVCEEKTEQASTYIHKLAGLYRYMLKSEEEQLVSLNDELEFATEYYELLKVRFPEGLLMETSIPDECLSRQVLPCALQLLIENATKHNAVNSERPLLIRISADEESVRVSNEIIPKVSHSPSTGLGLKYIRQQYIDICGKSVDIEHSEERFCVTIPLL